MLGLNSDVNFFFDRLEGKTVRGVGTLTIPLVPEPDLLLQKCLHFKENILSILDILRHS